MLLINLSEHTSNRNLIVDTLHVPDINNSHLQVPAVKALIEYFYKYEELAR